MSENKIKSENAYFTMKSEVAELMQDAYSLEHHELKTCIKEIAINAVIAAETEAEERHAKELQELKDRAVEAFKSMCDYVREDGTNYCPHYEKCNNECESVQEFLHKLI